MPVRALATVVVALTLVAATATAAPRFKATLTAPTHKPTTGTKWRYEVHASNLAGKPIRARVTVQIVDPLGDAHPVQFGSSTRSITNWPFKGVFRDYIIWPSQASGIKTTVRAIVKAKGTRVTLTYWVKPK